MPLLTEFGLSMAGGLTIISSHCYGLAMYEIMYKSTHSSLYVINAAQYITTYRGDAALHEPGRLVPTVFAAALTPPAGFCELDEELKLNRLLPPDVRSFTAKLAEVLERLWRSKCLSMHRGTWATCGEKGGEGYINHDSKPELLHRATAD